MPHVRKDLFMVQVRVSNNSTRNTIVVSEDTTLKAAFEQAGVDYAAGMPNLDGSVLRAGDINKTFGELGIRDTSCYLTSIQKVDNA